MILWRQIHHAAIQILDNIMTFMFRKLQESLKNQALLFHILNDFNYHFGFSNIFSFMFEYFGFGFILISSSVLNTISFHLLPFNSVLSLK